VELASNLVWIFLSALLLVTTAVCARRGTLRLTTGKTMILAVAVCFILLPVISFSDDLLEARQAAQPLSGQTWHLAREDAASAIELLSIFEICVFLLALAVARPTASFAQEWLEPRQVSAWLTRSQRLRPPPAIAR
jgi:hypothetical protein